MSDTRRLHIHIAGERHFFVARMVKPGGGDSIELARIHKALIEDSEIRDAFVAVVNRGAQHLLKEALGVEVSHAEIIKGDDTSH